MGPLFEGMRVDGLLGRRYVGGSSGVKKQQQQQQQQQQQPAAAAAVAAAAAAERSKTYLARTHTSYSEHGFRKFGGSRSRWEPDPCMSVGSARG
jgi:hypothetical protein